MSSIIGNKHILKDKTGFRSDLIKNSFAYRSIIPYVLFMLILVVYPVVQNVVVSFQVEDGWSFSNYREVLSDPLFSVVTLNTIIWTISCVILDLVVGLGIALLLSQDVRENGLSNYYSGYSLGHSDIVAAVAWKWMYNDMYGVLNDILVKLGIIKDYLPWLAVPTLAKAAVIIANLWKGFAISAMFLSRSAASCSSGSPIRSSSNGWSEPMATI